MQNVCTVYQILNASMAPLLKNPSCLIDGYVYLLCVTNVKIKKREALNKFTLLFKHYFCNTPFIHSSICWFQKEQTCHVERNKKKSAALRSRHTSSTFNTWTTAGDTCSQGHRPVQKNRSWSIFSPKPRRYLHSLWGRDGNVASHPKNSAL